MSLPRSNETTPTSSFSNFFSSPQSEGRPSPPVNRKLDFGSSNGSPSTKSSTDTLRTTQDQFDFSDWASPYEDDDELNDIFTRRLRGEYGYEEEDDGAYLDDDNNYVDNPYNFYSYPRPLHHHPHALPQQYHGDATFHHGHDQPYFFDAYFPAEEDNEEQDEEIVDLSHLDLTEIPSDLLKFKDSSISTSSLHSPSSSPSRHNHKHLNWSSSPSASTSSSPPSPFANTPPSHFSTRKSSSCLVKQLHLFDNLLSELPNTRVFTYSFAALRVLDLNLNKFEVLPSCVWSLANLQVLDVTSNKLTSLSLPPHSTTPLPLEKFILRKNHLTSLPEEIIGRYYHLRELDVTDNQLISLPASLFCLPCLCILRLSGNHLDSLPSTSVTSEPSANPSLSSFPSKSLRELKISNNRITKLPDWLGLLQDLEILHLSQNELEELPSWISSLLALQELYADRNKLSNLPEDIGLLISLRKLSLHQNSLGKLPTTIGDLIHLEQLLLSNNLLASLPVELSGLHNIQTLVIDGNPFHAPLDAVVHASPSAILSILQRLKEDPSSKLDRPEELVDHHLRIKLNDIRLHNKIGEGNFAEVVSGTWNSIDVAVKKILCPGDGNLLKLTEKNASDDGDDGDDEAAESTPSVAPSAASSPSASSSPSALPTTSSVASSSSITSAEQIVASSSSSSSDSSKVLRDFFMELGILCQLSGEKGHPFILQCFGAVIDDFPSSLMMVTEYAHNGSLFDILHVQQVPLKLPVKLKLMEQAAEAMYYLHHFRVDGSIIHRDLSSANMLITRDWDIKIADLGLSHLSSCSRDSSSAKRTRPVLAAYASPELLSSKPYDEKVDSFSFGTVLWELFAETIPFNGQEPELIRDFILNGGRLHIPLFFPSELSALITSCWLEDPSLRPSFMEIILTLRKMKSWMVPSPTPASTYQSSLRIAGDGAAVLPSFSFHQQDQHCAPNLSSFSSPAPKPSLSSVITNPSPS